MKLPEGETMLERYKSAGAALTMTLALGLPMQGLKAAEKETKAAEPQPVAEETVREADDSAPSNGIKTFDALAVRPVTFVSSVFSTGAFLLALPFAALDPAMDVEKTRKNLVTEPFQDTFQRPLGDFNGSAWGEPESAME
jgi:hypothetical protein